MTVNIKEIEDDLANSGDDYELLAKHRVTLSAYYSRLTEELKQILITKARSWNEIRARNKSNADAKAEWESSEDGIKEMTLKLDGKRIEKMMSSLKTLIDAQRTDYWNTHK